jgi:hypothetical protein
MPQTPPSFPSLTAEAACAALRAAGLALSPADIRVERRDEKWAVFLRDDRIAWFPADERGRDHLTIERKVLRLLTERCTFLVPRILFESPAGFDIRAAVPGRCDPWELYAEIGEDAALARQLGRAIGTILTEQHTRVAQADAEGWLPTRVSWPEPRGWIRERLVDVLDDKALIADIEQLLARYEGVTVEPADRVLVHADLGLHNLAVDPTTNEVRGVFDYGGAAWADRHHDFRYLVFGRPGEDMLEAALAVYEPAVGRSLNRKRIWLYNAACAACFLAFRRGIAAEQKWCGRTLAEDLAWTRSALDHAL